MWMIIEARIEGCVEDRAPIRLAEFESPPWHLVDQPCAGYGSSIGDPKIPVLIKLKWRNQNQNSGPARPSRWSVDDDERVLIRRLIKEVGLP